MAALPRWVGDLAGDPREAGTLPDHTSWISAPSWGKRLAEAPSGASGSAAGYPSTNCLPFPPSEWRGWLARTHGSRRDGVDGEAWRDAASPGAGVCGAVWSAT